MIAEVTHGSGNQEHFREARERNQRLERRFSVSADWVQIHGVERREASQHSKLAHRGRHHFFNRGEIYRRFQMRTFPWVKLALILILLVLTVLL